MIDLQIRRESVVPRCTFTVIEILLHVLAVGDICILFRYTRSTCRTAFRYLLWMEPDGSNCREELKSILNDQ